MKKYSQSLAISSIIGHILGVGDRHLGILFLYFFIIILSIVDKNSNSLDSNSYLSPLSLPSLLPPSTDNILMDFTTGQITHIDFSVCFGRGETLRVPETVPFRLTQNLERALGVWTGGEGGGGGVNGVFRVWGEGGLGVVRKHRGWLLCCCCCRGVVEIIIHLHNFFLI